MTSIQLLHDLLDSAAARWPTRPAVSRDETVVSYGQLAAASRHLARWLHEAGVRRGDRVVLAVESGVLVPCVVFAAARLGAVFTVLHDQIHGAGLTHVLRDCEPVMLVSDDPESRAAARSMGIEAYATGELSAAAFGAAFDAGFDAAFDAGFGMALGAAEGDAPATIPGPGPLAVDPVCLIYTSGTTALPKAVVSTHQQVVFATLAIQEMLGYRPDDVVYCALPMSFDYGLYQLFLGTTAGAHIALAPAAEAGPPLLRGLRDSGATILPGVPSMAEALAWLVRRASAPLSNLRLLTNTGAAISAATLAALRAALPGLRVQVMYGLTECKRTAIMPPDGDLNRSGSCGLPLPGTEVIVIGATGAELPIGEVGQFVVRGPNVMAGYWRRPDLTAEKFPRRAGLFPELRTGDYGWIDEDGYLYFSGRQDDLYKERGFRVSATEVEAAAHRVDGVVSAAVLRPREGTPSTLVVVGALTVEEVLDRMREQIEPFKVPRRCRVVDALPLTANGKVDRKRLAAMIDESKIPSILDLHK